MIMSVVLAIAVAAHSTPPCAAKFVGKRTGHSLAYDAKRQRVVMYGGSSDDATNPNPRSLWAWNGDAWECLDDNGPSGRRDAFLAYDAGRDRLVLFGGRTISRDRQMNFLRDTWEWDGTAW